MVWTCPACTYENSDGARVCDVCGKTRPSAVEQPAVTLPPPPPPQQDVLHHLRSAIARADVDEARRILARLGILLPEYTEDDPPTPPRASGPDWPACESKMVLLKSAQRASTEPISTCAT